MTTASQTVPPKRADVVPSSSPANIDYTEFYKKTIVEERENVIQCVEDFLMIEGLSPHIETLNLLLSTFLNDKENDWFKETITKTVSRTMDLAEFLAKISDLNDSIQFRRRAISAES
jgi:hypothetical protein